MSSVGLPPISNEYANSTVSKYSNSESNHKENSAVKTDKITIHVRIHDSIEVIEFTKDCTVEEIRSVFLAAADIPEISESLILRLLGPDKSLIPIGPTLESNSANEKDLYTLEITSGNHLNNFSFTK